MGSDPGLRRSTRLVQRAMKSSSPTPWDRTTSSTSVRTPVVDLAMIPPSSVFSTSESMSIWLTTASMSTFWTTALMSTRSMMASTSTRATIWSMSTRFTTLSTSTRSTTALMSTRSMRALMSMASRTRLTTRSAIDWASRSNRSPTGLGLNAGPRVRRHRSGPTQPTGPAGRHREAGRRGLDVVPHPTIFAASWSRHPDPGRPRPPGGAPLASELRGHYGRAKG